MSARILWRSLAGVVLACACSGGDGGGKNPPQATYDVDALGVPRFVATNYIDLTGLTRISLFRSHDGHDYSDDVETCRSMKHYFKFPTTANTVHAPVSGVVRRTMEGGTQVQIVSDAQPAFTFVIFHVAVASPLAPGDRVTEGATLGTHVGTYTFSDIAVEVNTPAGFRRVSYFDTLTDAAFAPYLARSIVKARGDFIITRTQRDAAPLECSGGAFVNTASDPYPIDVAF